MRPVLAAFASLAATAAHAQSASPQTAPSPWSLQEATGAPNGLRLSATVRLRWDSIAGQPRPGFNASDDIVTIRSSLFAEYDTGPVRIGGEIYDSRAYLADARTPIGTGEVDAIEPIQGYAALDLDRPFGRGSTATVQLGRFVLNLGSRRLVAADDYRNTTNSYGGVRVDLSLAGGWRGTAIYVLPTRRLPDEAQAVLANRVALDREGFDTVLWGGLVQRRGTPTLEISGYRFGERDSPGRPTRDRSLATLGGRLFREPAAGRVDYEVEGFYQWGSISAGQGAGAPQVPVSASFVHADVGYSWAGAWRPRVSLRFDYVSGDRPGRTFSRFDTLYGMRRAEIAPSGLYNAVGRANLLAPGVRIEAAPGRDTDVFAAWRPLWLASRTDSFSTSGVRDPLGRSGRFAGHQIEARLRHWLVRDALRFEAGLLFLARGRFLRDAPNATGNGDTRYGSLNLTAYL